MKKYVIVVAGGKGIRMGGDVPKQFLPLNGMPILMRTICRFIEYSPTIAVILVLPERHFEYWSSLCEKYDFDIPHRLVKGGETRFHSVKNGLQSIEDKDDCLVAVHDGVRPFVSVETIAATFDMAERRGGAIPVVECVDSIRMLDDDGKSRACDRSLFKLVQTPQTFRIETLRTSYSVEYATHFTDDASVVESAGYDISLVDGNRENIKITTGYDMKIAPSLL